jgi:hypothetical protein
MLPHVQENLASLFAEKLIGTPMAMAAAVSKVSDVIDLSGDDSLKRKRPAQDLAIMSDDDLEVRLKKIHRKKERLCDEEARIETEIADRIEKKATWEIEALMEHKRKEAKALEDIIEKRKEGIL